MNSSERRHISNLKERLQRNDCAGALRILQILLPRKASQKIKATRARKRADTERKIAKRRMTRDEIRAAVVERAAGVCEAAPFRVTPPGGVLSHGSPLRWDHWEGGSGDRAARESVETTWMLCLACDIDRTHNWPSTSDWNETRRRFCQAKGLVFEPHVEHAQVPAPQAPKAVPPHEPIKRQA